MLGSSPNCRGRGLLSTVYHGEAGVRTLRELARSYLTIRKDLTRVMNRLKALYRSWGIFYGGKQVYARRHRSRWLGKIAEAGVRRRAELCYDQLDTLQPLVRKRCGVCIRAIKRGRPNRDHAGRNSKLPDPKSSLRGEGTLRLADHMASDDSRTTTTTGALTAIRISSAVCTSWHRSFNCLVTDCWTMKSSKTPTRRSSTHEALRTLCIILTVERPMPSFQGIYYRILRRGV
jgi:hypothetical protein